jgi:hypothetical protein
MSGRRKRWVYQSRSQRVSVSVFTSGSASGFRGFTLILEPPEEIGCWSSRCEDSPGSYTESNTGSRTAYPEDPVGLMEVGGRE